jgi:hypothetical protein
VLVDDKLIFSKADKGRFPVEGEVEELFAALKEGREPRPVEEKKRPEGFISRALGKLRN